MESFFTFLFLFNLLILNMDEAILVVLSAAKQLYNDVKSTQLNMMKLKVTLNGVIEGLQSYISLSLEGKSKSIDSLRLAIENASMAVKQVQGRTCVTKYVNAYADKEAIGGSIELLNTALKALMTKIKLAN